MMMKDPPLPPTTRHTEHTEDHDIIRIQAETYPENTPAQKNPF